MKNLCLLWSLIGVLFLAVACDGVPDTDGFSLQQPDAEYELDTWGSNSEVYEFTPRGNKNMVCVMLMLDSGKAVGLQCFEKLQ